MTQSAAPSHHRTSCTAKLIFLLLREKKIDSIDIVEVQRISAKVAAFTASYSHSHTVRLDLLSIQRNKRGHNLFISFSTGSTIDRGTSDAFLLGSGMLHGTVKLLLLKKYSTAIIIIIIIVDRVINFSYWRLQGMGHLLNNNLNRLVCLT